MYEVRKKLSRVTSSSWWPTATCLVVGVLSSAAALPAQAASLPESYPLAEIEANAPMPVDANLDEWLTQHANRPAPMGLEAPAFKELLSAQDQPTALYLKLLRARTPITPVADTSTGSSAAAAPAATAAVAAPSTPATAAAAQDANNAEVRSIVMAALAEIAEDERSSRPEIPDHPLAPFLFLEMLRSGALTAEERPKVAAAYERTAAGSCAAKQVLLDDLTDGSMLQANDDAVLALIGRIDAFKAASFRKTAVRRLADGLPEAKRNSMGQRVLGLAQAYPNVVRAVPWLNALGEKHGKLASGGLAAGLDEVRRLAGKRQCSKAKDELRATIKIIKARESLDDVVTAAKAVDGCYRTRDPKLRFEFWNNVTDDLVKVFGDDGWYEARLRQGYLHWSSNDYALARPIFEEVIAKAASQGGKLAHYEARAIYALARISEQEGDFDKASVFYQDYVKRFAAEENAEDALLSLVLIHVDKLEWDLALTPLETLINTQSTLPIDGRPVGAMSFALFWSGRVYLAQNRFKEAGESWRRAASEYYSTFYGAMSHYMLEQLTGRRLALQPARTPPFRLHTLREAFAPDDQRRLKRAEAFLRLGLGDEAICEVEELDVADGKPEKQLARALALHASGRWLDAIKAYDALPRTFRHTLAAGLERLLFPRRYVEEVRALAKKAEVDPDLVLAIIRQESVFNPEARSPVGASGLMQLMPATAVMEAKRLSASYVTPDEKNDVRQKAASPRNLLDATTNLTLGVHHLRSLLARYGSPVYVLSAYNASPTAAERWMATIPTHDVLSFIERIPYKETRAYVKLVLRNYFYYKRWYGDPQDGMKHLEDVASQMVAMARQEGAREAATANH